MNDTNAIDGAGAVGGTGLHNEGGVWEVAADKGAGGHGRCTEIIIL